jgi:hypothetical protein
MTACLRSAEDTLDDLVEHDLANCPAKVTPASAD